MNRMLTCLVLGHATRVRQIMHPRRVVESWAECGRCRAQLTLRHLRQAWP